MKFDWLDLKPVYSQDGGFFNVPCLDCLEPVLNFLSKQYASKTARTIVQDVGDLSTVAKQLEPFFSLGLTWSPGLLRSQLNRGLKIRGRRWQRKRRWKSEFAFFQSLSRLLQVTYFVKCRRTLQRLNSKEPYPSSELREEISSSLVYFLWN